MLVYHSQLRLSSVKFAVWAYMKAELDTIARKEPFAAFWQAWQNARCGNDIPLRNDIKIRDFSQFLPNMIVYDYIGPGDIRYRLAGEAVSDRLGLGGTGMNVFDSFAPDAVELGQQWWTGIMETPCGGVSAFSVAYQNGIHRACEAINLPILGNENQVMVLAMVLAEKIIRVESRRENIRTGLDYSFGHFVDIGFGLPETNEFSFKARA